MEDTFNYDFEANEYTTRGINVKKNKANHKLEPINSGKYWKIPLIKDPVEMRSEATTYREIDYENPVIMTVQQINQSIIEICSR